MLFLVRKLCLWVYVIRIAGFVQSTGIAVTTVGLVGSWQLILRQCTKECCLRISYGLWETEKPSFDCDFKWTKWTFCFIQTFVPIECVYQLLTGTVASVSEVDTSNMKQIMYQIGISFIFHFWGKFLKDTSLCLRLFCIECCS